MSSKAPAQEDKNIEVWVDYKTKQFVNRYRFWIQNDFDFRYLFNGKSTSLYTYKLNLKIALATILDFRPGIDLRLTNIPNETNTFEVRTWQGFNLDWPNIGRVKFHHLYRIEQRFFFQEYKYQDDMALRSRYRLMMSLPINNESLIDKTFYINISSEYFFQHDKNVKEHFANNIRSGITLGFKNNSNWTYSLSLYSNRGKDNFNEDRVVRNNIFSFTVKKQLRSY